VSRAGGRRASLRPGKSSRDRPLLARALREYTAPTPFCERGMNGDITLGTDDLPRVAALHAAPIADPDVIRPGAFRLG